MAAVAARGQGRGPHVPVVVLQGVEPRGAGLLCRLGAIEEEIKAHAIFGEAFDRLGRRHPAAAASNCQTRRPHARGRARRGAATGARGESALGCTPPTEHAEHLARRHRLREQEALRLLAALVAQLRQLAAVSTPSAQIGTDRLRPS